MSLFSIISIRQDCSRSIEKIWQNQNYQWTKEIDAEEIEPEIL
jgi:hypothetical protein